MLEYATTVAPDEIVAWFYRERLARELEQDIAASHARERFEALGARALARSRAAWKRSFPNDATLWRELAAPLVAQFSRYQRPRLLAAVALSAASTVLVGLALWAWGSDALVWVIVIACAVVYFGSMGRG